MAETTEKTPRQPTWSTATTEMLLDRVSQGVLTVSADGNVTYANRTIAAMAGVPRSSLLGAPFLRLVPETDRARLGTALGAGRETPTQQRFALSRSEASELLVLMSFAPLSHGQASCLVTDLTDQKRREESADRWSRFLATLAEELRNVLRPMQNSLGALTHAQSLDEDARRSVASMQSDVDRTLALVEDIRKING